MVAPNTAPVYSISPNIGRAKISAANTNSDGTGTAIGTDIFLAFTAGANGSWITKIRVNLVANVAATPTVATVIRAFISTKTAGATSGGVDTFALQELAIGVQTADQTTAALAPNDIACNFALNAGQTILVTSHVAPAASTNWQATVYGGDF